MSGSDHTYEVTVRWTGNTGTGTSTYRDYGRDHDVMVEGKPTILGSADPAFRGQGDRWNPEDLLVASLSECHMLSYLSLCARRRIAVVAYDDRATGRMEQLPDHSARFVEVVLHPRVVIADAANRETALALHADAHRTCFIANSVNFPVEHRPEIAIA